MKKYTKAEMIAKNLPSGSYAAGCPAEETWNGLCTVFNKNAFTHKCCKDCERAQ